MAENRTYQDFEPAIEWKYENDCDTLNVYLPEFKKDMLRVQISSSGTLRISGERPLGGNKWKRFATEFHVSSNCDTNKLAAKFQGDILSVRQPKRIAPKENKENKPTAGSGEPEPKPKPKHDQPQPPAELHKESRPKPQKTNQETAQSAKKQSDEPLKQETAKFDTGLNKEKDKENRITFGDLAKKERHADKVQEEMMTKNKNRDDKDADEKNKKSLVKPGNQNRWISLVLVLVLLLAILVGLHPKYGRFFEGSEI